MSLDLQFVDETVARVGRGPEAVIPILQALQDHYGYLPEEGLRRVCETTQITPAKLSGVASFYDMFRHRPAGKHIVRVCRGTACHVTGAERVEDALRRELKIPAGQDTDAQGQFTIEPVACLGCCTLAPVVKIGENTFGHASAEKAPGILHDFLKRTKSAAGARSTEAAPTPANGRPQIHIGLGSCCMAKGSDQLFHALSESAERTGAEVDVKRVGCVGMCHRTPLVEVVQPGKPGTFYAGLESDQAHHLVLRHFQPRGLRQRLARVWVWALDRLLLDEAPEQHIDECALSVREPEVAAFLGKQVHLATEGFGKLDPLDLDEYVARGGFAGLAKAVGVRGEEPLKGRARRGGVPDRRQVAVGPAAGGGHQIRHLQWR